MGHTPVYGPKATLQIVRESAPPLLPSIDWPEIHERTDALVKYYERQWQIWAGGVLAKEVPPAVPNPVAVDAALEHELRGLGMLPPVVGPLAPMHNDV